MDTLTNIAIGVLGALIGAFLAYWLQRARPTLIIDNIGTTARFASQERIAIINDTLTTELEYYEVRTPFNEIARQGVPTEAMYADALEESQKQLESELKSSLPRATRAVATLRQLLREEEFERFETAFARDVDYVWMPLKTAFLRRVWDWPSVRSGYDEMPMVHESMFEDDEDWNGATVPLPGPMNIVLDFEGPPSQKVRLLDFGTRLVDALTHRHKADLNVALESARARIEERKQRTERLLQEIERELEPLRRFVVEGAVANKGRTPFSIGSDSKAVVLAKGHPTPSGPVPDDIDIDLKLGTRGRGQDLDFSPALVAAGDAVRFICIAKLPIHALETGASLHHAFKGGSLKTYLTVGILGKGRPGVRPFHSGAVWFRDFSLAPRLPRRRSLRRRGRR